MDNLKIRDYIINNFENNNQQEIKKAIEESIADGDEEVLPGLGVFFEIVWNNSSNEEQENMLKKLETNFKK